jgi:hypothetical protein
MKILIGFVAFCFVSTVQAAPSLPVLVKFWNNGYQGDNAVSGKCTIYAERVTREFNVGGITSLSVVQHSLGPTAVESIDEAAKGVIKKSQSYRYHPGEATYRAYGTAHEGDNPPVLLKVEGLTDSLNESPAARKLVQLIELVCN